MLGSHCFRIILWYEFWFLWINPSENILQTLRPISKSVTLPEVLRKTASVITSVPKEEFTEDKLVGLLRTFTEERRLFCIRSFYSEIYFIQSGTL